VVRLSGVPVDLYFNAAQHTAELVREFTLISMGEGRGVSDSDVPARLLALVDELGNEYSEHRDDIRSAFEEARGRGDAFVDVEVPADDTAADITDRLTNLLDEADSFCRAGNLLTLEAPPELVAWRHWWRDQVVNQIRNGADPVPFGAR